MISQHTASMIADLLDDPMTQMVMQADHVDRQALTVELSQLACQLKSDKSWAAARPWLLADRGTPAFATGVLSATQGAATKAGLAVCGAHCS